MANLAKRALFAVCGMVLVLGYWTWQQRHDKSSAPPAASTIPARVWAGGGGTVTIDVESSDAAVLRAHFYSQKKEGETQRYLDAYEKIPAGTRTWSIDVPPQTGGDLEFEANAPQTGSRLTWTVRSGDKQIAHDSEVLNAPLRSGEAFFLQVAVDDFATGKLEGAED